MRSPSHRLPRSSPYRWAIGAQDVSPGQTIENRYIVISPQVWRDTQLGHPTPPIFTADGELSNPALAPLQQALAPYYQLQQLRHAAVRAHLPVLDTVVTLNGQPIPLLRGGIDLVGQPYPTLYSVWKQATSTQQLNWLWELCPLWEALAGEGVATSLLQGDNLRVDGDRLCLLSLVGDPPGGVSASALGRMWLPWTTYAGAIAAPLQRVAHQLQRSPSPQGLFSAEYQLNHLRLQTAAQPFTVAATHATAGRNSGSQTKLGSQMEPLASHAAMGHAAAGDRAAEIFLAAVCQSHLTTAATSSSPPQQPLASQILQSLDIQVNVMGKELARCRLLSPRWVMPQILAMVRVLNNVIAQIQDEVLSLAFAMAIPQPVSAPPPPEGDSKGDSPYRQSLADPPGPQDDQRLDSVAHEVYVFTVGPCFVYQLWPQTWRRVAPAAILPISFLGSRRDAHHLQGQLQRLVVDRDQALLLSTCALDEVLNQKLELISAALESEADLDGVLQQVLGKTTGQEVAIALLRHQGQASPPLIVSPDPTFDSAPQDAVSQETSSQNTPSQDAALPLPAQPDAVPAEATVDQHRHRGAPYEAIASDFEDDGDAIGGAVGDAAGNSTGDWYSSLTHAEPGLDDSIDRYIDAEVRPPRPAANTISDRDIDKGLSTLISPRLPESELAHPRDRPLQSASSRTQQPRTKPVRMTPARTTPVRTTPTRTTPARTSPKSRAQGRRAKKHRRPGLALLALLMLSGGVVLLWQRYPQWFESFEPWFTPQTQPEGRETE